ncbi:hypothetical protein ACWCXX_17160 [Streptomyces sp. NPDC001732]
MLSRGSTAGNGFRPADGIHGRQLFVPPGLGLVAVHSGPQVVSPDVPVAPLVQALPRIGTRPGSTR